MDDGEIITEAEAENIHENGLESAHSTANNIHSDFLLSLSGTPIYWVNIISKGREQSKGATGLESEESHNIRDLMLLNMALWQVFNEILMFLSLLFDSYPHAA